MTLKSYLFTFIISLPLPLTSGALKYITKILFCGRKSQAMANGNASEDLFIFWWDIFYGWIKAETTLLTFVWQKREF